jgi:hypothetical protein
MPLERRKRRQKQVVAIVGAAVAGLTAGLVIHDILPHENNLAVGVVKCAGQAAVEGVWIDARPASGSGWAHLQPANGSADTVSFSRKIGGSIYSLHTGCGGTPTEWRTANYTQAAVVADETVGLICALPESQPTITNIPHGVCKPTDIILSSTQ